MKNKLLMCVFAHPDDESFTAGLTISKYKKNGWSVVLLCATNGEKGKSKVYNNISDEAMAIVRRSELEDAAKVLGIDHFEFLDYQDGELNKVESGDIEDVIYQKMISYAPCVVITFDSKGMSNHPDHIRISFSASYAFQRYAKEVNQVRKYKTQVELRKKVPRKRKFLIDHKNSFKQGSFIDFINEKTEPKLYHVCVPQSTTEYLIKNGIISEKSFGKPRKGVSEKKITTVIDGSRLTAKKKRALLCHKSQEPDIRRFLNVKKNPLMLKEFFMLRQMGVKEIFFSGSDKVSDRL